jgi:hypothetical protein
MGDWPKPGATFEHSQGVWPLRLHDTTSVVSARRPSRLLLEVRMRPFLVGRVEFRLRPAGRGRTHVVMREHPVRGPVARVHNPLSDLLFRLRNAETLRRLRRLAEERAAAGG